MKFLKEYIKNNLLFIICIIIYTLIIASISYILIGLCFIFSSGIILYIHYDRWLIWKIKKDLTKMKLL
jgi:hypothetical protein